MPFISAQLPKAIIKEQENIHYQNDSISFVSQNLNACFISFGLPVSRTILLFGKFITAILVKQTVCFWQTDGSFGVNRPSICLKNTVCFDWKEIIQPPGLHPLPLKV